MYQALGWVMEADELWRIDSYPAPAHTVLKGKTEGTS